MNVGLGNTGGSVTAANVILAGGNSLGVLNVSSGTFTSTTTLQTGNNGGALGTGIINVTGGLVNTQGVQIGAGDSLGVLNVSGGTFNSGFYLTTGNGSGSTNSGIINVTGGTMNLSQLTVCESSNTPSYFNQSGGVVNETGQNFIGRSGNSGPVLGGNAGIMNLTGGTFNYSLQNNFNMGSSSDQATAIVNVSGTANLNMSGGILGLNMGQNWGSTASVNQTGGNVTIANTSIFGVIFEDGEGCQITYNLSGGTLTTPAITAFGGNTGQYTSGGPNNNLYINQSFIFNGGTLVANRNMTVPEISGSIQGYTFNYPPTNFTTTIGPGGANINTSGYSITWATPLVSAGNDGGLTKSGAGALILSASNTFTGNINVLGGSVEGVLTASLPNYATPGHITVAAGAGLTLGVGGAGQFSDSNIPTVLSAVTFAGSNTFGLDASLSPATIATNIPDGANGVRSLFATGTNVLTLTGSNTYTGGTFIGNNVTLNVGSAGALGTTGPIQFDNVRPVLQYSSANNTDYSSRFTTAPNQAFGIDTNGVNVSYAYPLSSSNGYLNKVGAGTLTLAANGNSLMGFQVDGGTLDITGTFTTTGNDNNFDYVANGGTNGGISGTTATLIIDTNATFNITGSYNDTFVIGRDSGSGTLIQNAGSTFNSDLTVVVGASGSPITSAYNMNGGTLNLTNSANLYVGLAPGATGVLNVGPGSSINIGLGGTLEVGIVGSPGGTVNMNGGSITIDPYSALTLTDGVGSTAVFNLNGGVVTTGQVFGAGGAATLNFNGGTLKANAGNSPFISGLTSANVLGNTSTIDNGGFGITIAQPLLHGGSAAIDGGLVFQGSGTTTLSVANSYTGATTVTAGTLAITAPGAFPTFTALNVASGALVAVAPYSSGSPKNTLFTTGLSLGGSTNAWTGKIDLANNDMVVRGGAIATVTNQVGSGYANGTWQGTGGIVSTTAAADSTHLTALGVIQNSTNGSPTGTAIYTTFDGESVGNTDVLVKYTYYGDADLDGKVDGSDYSRIDNGALLHLSGWYNGDFNYDGVINGSDYTLIDNAYNTQGAQLSAQVAAATAQVASGVGTAVPEPATLSVLAIGAVGLLSRRRRSV
jgi:autotransporter-associated beta strand protein